MLIDYEELVHYSLDTAYEGKADQVKCLNKLLTLPLRKTIQVTQK